MIHCFIAVIAPRALGDVGDSTYHMVYGEPTMHYLASLHELGLGTPIAGATHSFPKNRVTSGVSPFVFVLAVVEERD